MELSDYLKKYLIDELRLIEKKIDQEDDPFRKAYILSATYAVFERVLKIEFNSLLLLANVGFVFAYNQIQGRISDGRQGVHWVPFEMNIFDKLREEIGKLANAIEEDKDQDIYPVVERVLLIAYSTSGPGNYLLEKGTLKL